jgi:NAD(P)-dependent dehydrogenase (short-subunit alcohol dehydrogenase family)
MSENQDLNHQTWLVLGASSGLGRGIAQALAEAGARVVAVARTEKALASLAAESTNITARPGDASDPTFVAHAMADVEPAGVFLVAGARPVMLPLHQQDWASFSANWEVDAKSTFHWVQAAMHDALAGGSLKHLVVVSSGAAVFGSPLSGGYAPAKQAQRFLCDYARAELARHETSLRIQCLLPGHPVDARQGRRRSGPPVAGCVADGTRVHACGPRPRAGAWALEETTWQRSYLSTRSWTS